MDILLNTNLFNLENDILSELESLESRCEFILNKYTWDRKKPYDPNCSQKVRLVENTRYDLSIIKLKIRRIKKLGNI